MTEQNSTTLSQLFRQVRAQEIPIETVDLWPYIYEERLHRLLPVEMGAESLYQATWLIYLKSIKLLPKAQIEEVEEPIVDTAQLEQHLQEYQMVRKAALELRALGERQRAYFTRPVAETSPVPIKKFGIEHLTLEELGQLFQKALKKVEDSKVLASSFIQVEGESVTERLLLLKKRIEVSGALLWDEVFVPQISKQDLILWFLALLEWLKEGCGYVALESEEYIIRQQSS